MFSVPDEVIPRINEICGKAIRLFLYYCKNADEDGVCSVDIATTT